MKIFLRCLQGGNKSESNSRNYAEKQRKNHNDSVDFRFAEPRNCAGTDRTQRRHQRGGKKDSKRSTAHGKQNAFAQQLPHQSPARSAKRLSHGNFPIPCGSARQKKIGNIDASNQKNEPYSSQQHQQ